LEKIIKKAAQKNKKDRYQSCEDFNNDLYQILISNSKNIVKEKQKENYFLKIFKILSLFCFGFLGPFFFTETYDPIKLYVGEQYWFSSELTGRFVKYWTLLFSGSIEPYIRQGQILSFLPLLVYTFKDIIRILKNIK
jgi:hypothetical protein